VAMLMSDIRGFTSLSESLSPEGTISILNRYFSHMIDVIKQYKGIIVDFFGDSVLVFFDPLEGPIEAVALRSVRCALHMQGMMDQFNAEMKGDGLPEFQMGIGVNVGKVVVGNIGSESRAKYGIVGSAVNITQRIQTVARGKDVVISDAVYEYVANQVLLEKSFTVQLKGLEEDVKLHLIRGIRPQT
jgi:adenylate cyclase